MRARCGVHDVFTYPGLVNDRARGEHVQVGGTVPRIQTPFPVVFEISHDVEMPIDRACGLHVSSGIYTVKIRPGEAQQALCSELNELHRFVMQVEGRWLRTGRPAGAPGPRPSGASTARVEWHLTPPRAMPHSVPCIPLERPGEITWAINSRYASTQLSADLNELIAEVSAREEWLQCW
ncbi:hypothetical protein GCM10023082_26990 [Streptomyces tremellae]|uniref:Condensation domain-containing protein n=1 Tax=Streptomyces tremellae TaxID=1124239 RepID=A0ABP7F013_9ACTN